MQGAPKLLFRAATLISDQGSDIYRLNKRISFEIPGNFIKKTISLCDGTRTYEDVICSLGEDWERSSVESFINELLLRKIIVYSSHLSDEVWDAVKNPMPFSSDISGKDIDDMVQSTITRQRCIDGDYSFTVKKNFHTELLCLRKSVRQFSGETIDVQKVVNMIWCAYGEYNDINGSFHRTVPSAGALYPIIIHLALFNDTNELPIGIYRVYYDHSGNVNLKLLTRDIFKCMRSFMDPSCLMNGASGVIILSGSFNFTEYKYSNRALPYVLLEAGHIAQNIHLEAVNQNIATLEIGGFVDDLLIESIDLSAEYTPIITIAFGQLGNQNSEKNDAVEIDWAIPMAGQYRPGFAMASAKLPSRISWSHGRDPSPEVALTKAISEAKEWASCGCVPKLKKSRFKDLSIAVNPEDIIRFHPSQYETPGFPFKPFNNLHEYSWTNGYVLGTGRTVNILADNVYFPYFPDSGSYYAYANSSGCAAHPDELKAIQTSVFEIIERDSFMNIYLCKLSRPTINNETLPKNLQERIKNLESSGFNVWIKDHTLDIAPVVFVLAQNDSLNFTICASCSSFDIEYATGHALMEVEATIVSRLQNGPPKSILPNDVVMPLDHSNLYGQKEYYKNADFLIKGGNVIPFDEVGNRVATSWEELLDSFHSKDLRVIIIPLELSNEYGGNGDLHIVRCIIPGMVPMTFGYQQEPTGMDRIYNIAKEFGGKNITYNDLTKFPHPFG